MVLRGSASRSDPLVVILRGSASRSERLVVICRGRNQIRGSVRQWRLVQLLNASRAGLRIEKLMEETEFSRPTEYRDLRLLREAGVPIDVGRALAVSATRLRRSAKRPEVPGGAAAIEVRPNPIGSSSKGGWTVFDGAVEQQVS